MTDDTTRRLITEHACLFEVAYAIDAVIHNRVDVLVMYGMRQGGDELTMGGCLKRLHEVVRAISDGRPVEPWVGKGA